jgi:hypothetical protein
VKIASRESRFLPALIMALAGLEKLAKNPIYSVT